MELGLTGRVALVTASSKGLGRASAEALAADGAAVVISARGREALDATADDLRSAVLLSEYEDRSHTDIAEVLGCSTKAVEMKLYRARQTLRERLTRWLQG